MPGIFLKVSGVEELQKRFKNMPRKAQRAFDAALHGEAKSLLAESKAVVPVSAPRRGRRPGRLKRSGKVRKEKSGGMTSYSVGHSAPYAIYVHEIRGGRGYKWLARAAKRIKRGLYRRLRRTLVGVLRGRSVSSSGGSFGSTGLSGLGAALKKMGGGEANGDNAEE
jgi:hypothetical protein